MRNMYCANISTFSYAEIYTQEKMSQICYLDTSFYFHKIQHIKFRKITKGFYF